MKQTKYRDKLQNRSIEPSSGSWEQLEASLDAHDKKDRKSWWQLLKVAAAVLLLISISYYTLSPKKNLDDQPVVTTPTIQKDLLQPVESNPVSTTEIKGPETKAPVIDRNTNEPQLTASKEDPVIVPTSDEDLIQVSINDSITGLIEVADIPKSDEQLIDSEVEDLLRKSKIKLLVNGQIRSEKVVSSEALLNSVEEDLYMDLKQKLIEKITTKLKNPKEVITSRDD